MDIFMSPSDDSFIPVRAPYVGKPASGIDGSFCALDELKFEDYPSKAGFGFWKTGQGLQDDQPVSVYELAQLLQSWLFFGLISKFFGKCIDPLNFVEYGEIRATTDALQYVYDQYEGDMLVKVAKEFPWNRLSVMDAEEQRMNHLLDFARSEHDLMSIKLDEIEAPPEAIRAVAKISLSVSLLIDCLADIYMGFNPPKRSFMENWASSMIQKAQQMDSAPQYWRERHVAFPFGARHSRMDVRLLLELFENRGWCPVRAEQMSSMLRFRACNYLCSITRHDTPPGGHEACRSHPRCLAFNIDEATYQMSHSEDCSTESDCTPIKIEAGDLEKIVDGGGIPLLSMGAHGDLDIKLVPHNLREGYTAISHVWADGLGNPKDNALMRCQLVSLRDSVLRARVGTKTGLWKRFKAPFKLTPQIPGAERSDRILVWIDTLCIPARKATTEERMLKQKAIKLIAAVFAGANRIVIREKGLQRQSNQSIDSHISGLRIIGFIVASKWVERAWTLEESCMASLRCIEMQDESIIMPSVKALNQQSRSWNFRERLEGVLLRSLFRWFDYTLYSRVGVFLPNKPYTPAADAQRFAKAWNDLSYRTMTKKNDGPIILANLMDINTTALVKAPVDERMPLLVRNCRGIPLSLLYLGNGIYHDDSIFTPKNGERWLPLCITAELLHHSPYMIPVRFKDGEGALRCKGWGHDHKVHLLELSTAGYLSGIPFSVMLDCTSSMHKERQTMYIVEPVARRDAEASLIQLGHTQTNEPFPDKLCLVLDEHISSASRTGIRARGAIFDIKTRENSTNFLYGRLELSFRASIIARTLDQWEYNQGHDIAPSSMPSVVKSQLLPLWDINVDISTDDDEWPGDDKVELLSRRLYSKPKLVSLRTFFRGTPLQHFGGFLIFSFLLVCMMLVENSILFWLFPPVILLFALGWHWWMAARQFNVERWRTYLKSFEEDLNHRPRYRALNWLKARIADTYKWILALVWLRHESVPPDAASYNLDDADNPID